MAIQLKKSEGIKLSKGLEHIRFVVAWGSNEDVDISAMILKDGQAILDEDYVFYHNRDSITGAVKHLGDVRDGSRQDGDDETIKADLNKFELDRNQLLFVASIYDAATKGVDFGKIGKVVCKLINDDTNEVLATYQVDKDLDMEVCGVLCAVKKQDNGEWKFEAVGQPYNSIESLLSNYGFEVD